jgi:hypothetical protein
LQCLLYGLLGIILALFSTLVVLIAGPTIIPWSVSYRSQGEIGWDPVSLAKHEPLMTGVLLLLFVSFLAWGFRRGYLFRARRTAQRKVA